MNLKKTAVLFLLTLASFSLFAQNFRELKIYVPPIDGEGVQGDNAYFYGRLSYEVAFQKHSLVRALRGSDFTIKGSIITLEKMLSVVGVNSNSYYDARIRSNDSLVFNVELLNSATGEVIGDQYVIYNRIDSSVERYVSTIVYNLLSGIPDIEIIEDWRDRWVFLEATALWAPRIYRGKYDSVNWANFGLRLAVDVQFLNFLALDAGISFIQDRVVVSATEGEFRDLILEIPIALKAVIKPRNNYLMIEPYGGISINSSLMEFTKPSTLSWFAGTQLGIKAGPGMLVIDPRFTMDFSKSYINNANKVQYQRYMLQIGLGYKIGFFRKKPKLDY